MSVMQIGGRTVQIEAPSPQEKRQAERELFASMIPAELRATRAEALARWKSLSEATCMWQCVDFPRLIRVRCVGSDDPIVFDCQERTLLSDEDARTAVKAFQWLPLE